jgi:hypothetical protein
MTHVLRHISSRRLLAVGSVLAAFAFAIAFLPGPASATPDTAHAAQHRGCSVRTLQGSYGGDLTGTSTSTGPTAGQVVETFRGNGTGTADVILMTQAQGPLSFNGEPVTYTLNTDCTGTLTALRGGEAHHFAIVVTGSGRKIYQLRTDTGNAMAGTLEHT